MSIDLVGLIDILQHYLYILEALPVFHFHNTKLAVLIDFPLVYILAASIETSIIVLSNPYARLVVSRPKFVHLTLSTLQSGQPCMRDKETVVP